MKTVVSLLRGINVGGNNVVSMRDLRAVLVSLDLTDVRTYLQSGNAVFRTQAEVRSVAARIRMAIHAQAGIAPDVVAIEATVFEAQCAANPFPDAEDAPKTLHLYFPVEPPDQPDLALLEAVRSDGERFELIGDVFYLHTPNGFGRSKVANRVERALGVPATARNWRTVTTLAAMARPSSPQGQATTRR